MSNPFHPTEIPYKSIEDPYKTVAGYEIHQTILDPSPSLYEKWHVYNHLSNWSSMIEYRISHPPTVAISSQRHQDTLTPKATAK